MNIPKDGPDASTSGPQRQEAAPKAGEPGGIPFPGQNVMGAQHEQGSGQPIAPQPPSAPSTLTMPALSAGAQNPSQPAQPEEVVDPMAKLAEIIAQSPAAPVQAPPPAPVPMPVLQQSHQAAVPLPPPVAVPQIEVTAEDRPAAPVAQPSGKRFSLFRRKPAQKAAPTVAELTEPQAKGGFFARRAARKQAERAAQVQSKRTNRDKRYQRRRRRVWFEELLGWIFVPIILIGLYFAAVGALALLGMTPETVIQGLKTLRTL